MTLLRLSPFARFLTADRADGRVERGMAHALTGNTVGISADLHRVLRALARSEVPRTELEKRCTTTASRRLVGWLIRHHFLIAGGRRGDVLRPFLSYRLVLPAMNPAVTCLSARGRTLLVRIRNMGVSVSPRPPGPPAIMSEFVPPGAGEFIDAARDRMPLHRAIGRHRSTSREILGSLAWLTARQRQLIRLGRPGDDVEGYPHHLHYLIHDFRRLAPNGIEPEAARLFYASTLRDVDWNFDWLEPTIAHAFRYPTGVLGGMTYGERFFSRVWRELLSRRNNRSNLDVLEVGGGTGAFARAVERLARRTMGSGARLRYTLLDWSPAALDRQRRELQSASAEVRFVRQDAEGFAFPGERFDVILANEMIADLRVETGPARRLVPVGLFALLRSIRAHLRHDGIAALSEYGTADGRMERVDHFGHAEYSIDFRAAGEYATSIGLAPRTVPLAAFVEADQDIDVLCGMQEHYACINHVLAPYGSHLPYAVWDRAGVDRIVGEVAARARLSGLTFAPAHRGLHYGPALSGFSVLLLTMDS